MSAKATTRITSVETRILRIPTIRPHTLAMATMQEQRIVLLSLKTDDGLEGYGEATTIGELSYIEESPETIKLVLDQYCAPLLVEADINRLGEVLLRINQGIVGNYLAKCAVETALLDLTGKRLGIAVSELLGGRVRDHVAVAWGLASGDTQKDIEEGKAMLAQRRHNIFKIKLGKRAWKDDVAHVAAICDALGNQASIRVDINQAWDIASARRAVPALSEAGVDLIEQPLALNDYAGAYELRALGGAAIMADEAMRGGPKAGHAIISHRAADAVALKIGQSGGLFACRDQAVIALAGGIDLYGGTMLEGGVGTIASAQLFSTLPKLAWGTELFGPLLLQRDILKTSLDYKDFSLRVPTGPGLGIEVDHAAVDEFTE